MTDELVVLCACGCKCGGKRGMTGLEEEVGCGRDIFISESQTGQHLPAWPPVSEEGEVNTPAVSTHYKFHFHDLYYILMQHLIKCTADLKKQTKKTSTTGHSSKQSEQVRTVML